MTNPTTITTIQPVPDYIGAYIGYLQLIPALQTVFPTLRITGRIPDTAEKGFWLLVEKASGTDDPYVPLLYPNVTLKCYGPDGLNAMKLWRYVHPVTDKGFQHDGIVVPDARLVSGPTGDVDPDDGWPLVWAIYRWTVTRS